MDFRRSETAPGNISMPPQTARLGGRLQEFLSAALARKAPARRPRRRPALTPPGRIAAEAAADRHEFGVKNTSSVGGKPPSQWCAGNRKANGDKGKKLSDTCSASNNPSTRLTRLKPALCNTIGEIHLVFS